MIVDKGDRYIEVEFIIKQINKDEEDKQRNINAVLLENRYNRKEDTFNEQNVRQQSDWDKLYTEYLANKQMSVKSGSSLTKRNESRSILKRKSG